MKKSHLLFLAFVLIGFNCLAQWIPQNSGTTNNLNSVYFTDANTGYAVGNTGTILKTMNGGENWIAQSSNTSTDLRSVYFTDSNTGYTVGYGSLILKTINGGENWISQDAGVSVNLNSVFFTATDTGYVVGNFWDNEVDSGYNYILKTIDGGMLWSSSYVYATNEDFGAPYLYSIHFPDANTGYVSGEWSTMMPQPLLLKTTNGGADWADQYPNNDWGINSVYFINPDTGYVANPMIKTTNGGIDWESVTLGFEAMVYSLYFTDANTGYAVGTQSENPPYGNIILKTSDGGTYWTVQYLGNVPNSGLESVHFVNENIGFAVGSTGTILKTTNGGLTSLNERGIVSQSLKIFPSPVKDKITISSSTLTGISQLSIFNVSGEKVLERQLTDYETQIDISTLPQGVYFVRLQNEKVVKVGKIVKE